MIKKLVSFIPMMLLGCVTLPKDIEPVKNFDIHRYLGAWYEIVRLDHSFERGLEKVTANYSLKDDGGIKVVNRGFDPNKNKWKMSVGKAYFVNDSNIGQLKVSFFGPFYGAYNIIVLDETNYSYAMVCGPSKTYLWILARESTLEDAIKTRLITKAKELGFDTERLIHVKHQ